MVIPTGVLNDAAVPIPSAYAAPDPAKVVTSPDEMTILRIRLLI
jgi:hypothetical protein